MEIPQWRNIRNFHLQIHRNGMPSVSFTICFKSLLHAISTSTTVHKLSIVSRMHISPQLEEFDLDCETNLSTINFLHFLDNAQDAVSDDVFVQVRPLGLAGEEAEAVGEDRGLHPGCSHSHSHALQHGSSHSLHFDLPTQSLLKNRCESQIPTQHQHREKTRMANTGTATIESENNQPRSQT